MLEYLDEQAMATTLEAAITRSLSEGVERTYDMGGSSSTLDLAKDVAARIEL
jgi:isocitrate/isopropylmalate dehydrogenase